MSFESIINRVKTIPPLPESIIKIEKLFARENPNLSELVKIVEEDSVLTADLLSMVNSPLYSFSKEIISVQQAITLFGMNSIRGFVLATISKNSFEFDMSMYNISNKEFQEISTLQSMLMFQWYMTINIEQSSLLVPIAFLMETGKIIIANEVSKSDYKDEFSRMIKEDESIEETERLFTGLSSSEVTALLFEHWNFNDIFVNIIKGSSDLSCVKDEYKQYAQAIDIVKTAINAKEIMTQESIEKAMRKLSSYGFDAEKFKRTVKRLEIRMEDM